MKSFFPNLWGADHGDWALFLLHEFLGYLYHLITWQGGFNSGFRPVYFGMDKISLWVKLLYWYVPQLPS